MDARRAADRLGIPFYVWDFSERFRDDVIEDFVAEYRRAAHPTRACAATSRSSSPRCSSARSTSASTPCAPVTTRRCVDGDAGALELHRASRRREGPVVRARSADGRAARAHATSRSATTPSKALVRAEAEARGLTVAQKPDSHDICFIPDGDTRGWLAERSGPRTGEIVDRSGAVVGSHEGAHAFTVGQRRGLALGVPAADGKPRFVLEVRPVSNTVVVGPKEALAIAEIAGARFTLGRARPTDVGCSRATCRSARTPIRCRRSAVLADGRRACRARDSRSTASPPGRPPCCTTARACSASSRSTAPCRRFRSTSDARPRHPARVGTALLDWRGDGSATPRPPTSRSTGARTSRVQLTDADPRRARRVLRARHRGRRRRDLRRLDASARGARAAAPRAAGPGLPDADGRRGRPARCSPRSSTPSAC